MFEVETSTRNICLDKNCEVLIMTGNNEYIELTGLTDDYGGMEFDWANMCNQKKVALPPPMLCA